MKIRKKSDNLFKISFGGKRRGNRYAKSWRNELGSYGKADNKSTSWWAHVLKQLRLYLPAMKRKSYLSRREIRQKFGKKAIRFVLITAAVIVTVAAARKPVNYFAQSLEFFNIKKINVTGCSSTKPSDIKAVSGYDFNTSIFAQSPEAVARKIEQYPWVKDVVVTRIWPDEIVIEITEHKAAALMVKGEVGNERMVYVDKKGVEIAPLVPGNDLDFPVITGVNVMSQQQKSDALGDAAAFMRLIGRNNANLPAQSISEIHFNSRDGMIVRLVDFPFPIYFGKGEVKKKYKQLRSVMAVLYKKRKRNVDISNIEYIRMDYLKNKVLVSQSNSG